jgi:dTDP-4-dehydrorhamnose 3,5-epimerase
MTMARPIGDGTNGTLVELFPQQFQDERGSFSEVYSKRTLAELGIDLDFVQDNESFSRAKGTVRGLHFQRPPHAQAKLVRVLRGSIHDVAVDIRVGSPTYGQHISMVISAEAYNQVFIPVGFAHGFCTLEPDTVVLYKTSALYSKAHEGGILWSDPDLGIAWPVEEGSAMLSDKDKVLPRFRDVPECFVYGPARSATVG